MGAEAEIVAIAKGLGFSDIAAPLWMLGYALAQGLLIGLERGWTARDDAAGSRVAGFRTFGIIGLAGGVAGLLPIAPATAMMLAVSGLLIAGYVRESRDAGSKSATSMCVGLLVLMLGMMATTGHGQAALATSAVVTLLLSMREILHGWLRGINEAEMRSFARFALISLVVLPLLPDRPMGPFGAWNPHQLWLVVVIVCGLSFAGYIAARRVGAGRGLLVTALLGAMVSSTAVTADYARRLRTGDGPSGILIAGIALASAVMFARVLVLTALLAGFALPMLAKLLIPGLLVATGLAVVAARGRIDGGAATVRLGNPLEIGPALGLAALVAGLSVASHWAQQAFGDIGVAGLLALTGLADVDAAIVTLANMKPGAIDPHLAGFLLALPVLLNSLFKAGIAIVFAPGRFGWRAAALIMASVGVSAITMAVLW